MITSHQNFVWFVSALTMGVAAPWFVVDIIRLRRALRSPESRHDRVFGSIIGLMVSAIGIIGVLRHHLG